MARIVLTGIWELLDNQGRVIAEHSNFFAAFKQGIELYESEGGSVNLRSAYKVANIETLLNNGE